MKSEKSGSTSNSTSEELNDTLWSIGWQFGLMCFFAILFAITAIYISGSYYSAAVSFIAIYPWLKGTRLINKNWKNVYDDKLRQAEKTGANQCNINPGEADIYQLIVCSGRAIKIIPNCRYHITFLYVGETFLAIYDGVTIDMVNREFISRGSSTKKLHYTEIKTVDYSRPNFMVHTNSGDKLSYKAGTDNEEPALEAIRKKLL